MRLCDFCGRAGTYKKVNDTQWIYTKMINLNKHKNILKKLC